MKLTKEYLLEIQPKLQELSELVSSFPFNSGEQFVNIELNLHSLTGGTLSFGLRYKSQMGEMRFYTLDEAIKEVKEIKKMKGYNPKFDED